METIKTKPLDVLDKSQLSEIRLMKDFRNIFALCFDWGMMTLGLAIFYYFPGLLTFLLSVVIIGSRQFALAVLAHEGAHNLLFSNSKADKLFVANKLRIKSISIFFIILNSTILNCIDTL